MNTNLIKQEFEKIINTEDSRHFNIISRSFSTNNREEYIYRTFKDYRVFSDKKGAELLFKTKKYKGVEHIYINIDKERFAHESNINFLELYKHGIIFAENEFFVF